MKASVIRRLVEVNRELWLILSMVIIVALLNFLLVSHYMLLSFYTIPTVFSAYYFGRRHATLTALASVLLVILVVYFNPSVFTGAKGVWLRGDRWIEITIWGGMLLVTADAMGRLYENKEARLRELRETYHGVLLILRQFIAKDKYTENHSYRVSIYAAKLAAYLDFDSERVEDVRAAAMLHDIGKLDVSRSLLYKAARLTQEEFEEMKKHAEEGVRVLESVGGSLRRVIPIVLAHHDKFDGSGYHPTRGEEIPLEARIIAVADVYDALTSDRPYRKALSPFEARDIIVKGAGTDFDPKVVEAFVAAFRSGDMEIPGVVV